MASLYTHKYGYRIVYKLFFPDGSFKVKHKYSTKKQKALLILKDIEKLELYSMKNRLERDDILFALHMKYISQEEVRSLTGEQDYVTSSITWAHLEKIYRNHYQTVGSKQTRISYPYKIKPILKYFKDTSPEKLTIEAIRNYITQRRMSVTKATVNKEITALRIMLDYLVENNILKDNPARQIKRFSDTPTRLPRCLQPEELRSILNTIPNYYACRGYFPELILTYLFTGLRRYELLELQTNNVDMRKKIIKVIGKGDKERMIDIHPYLLQIIFPSVIIKNGDRRGIYFFGGYDKPFMNENSVGRAFRIFLRRHKIYNNNSLHTLRHTFITYLIEAGASLKEVQRIAGHESLKTTLKYTHLVPPKDPAINKLDYNKFISF